MISKARQGNTTMHMYPFANLWKTGKKEPGKKRRASGASRAIAFEANLAIYAATATMAPPPRAGL